MQGVEVSPGEPLPWFEKLIAELQSKRDDGDNSESSSGDVNWSVASARDKAIILKTHMVRMCFFQFGSSAVPQ